MSQKARGLDWLSKHMRQYALPTLYAEGDAFALHDMYYRRLMQYGKLFVRPCPKSPRHGILESGVSTDVHDFTAKVLELRKLDPEASVVVQEYVPATASAVWADGTIVAGLGHDGVTAGHGPQLVLNLEGPGWLRRACSDLGLEDAEVELVMRRHKMSKTTKGPTRPVDTYITQIREATGHFKVGNRPNGALAGFCQEPVDLNATPRITIRTNEDLRRLETYDGPPPLVIHRNGSIASHAAAWARQKGYPFVALQNGEKLKGPWLIQVAKGWVTTAKDPSMQTATKMNWYEDQFFDGATAAAKAGMYKELMSLALVFHLYASGTSVSPESAYIAGYFLGALAKITAIIATAECRYARSNGDPDIQDQLCSFGLSPDTERHTVYNDLMLASCSIDELSGLLRWTSDLFNDASRWPNRDFGGSRWAAAAGLAIRITEAISARNQKEANVAGNSLLMLIHNTGWLFNKITTPAVLSAWKPLYYRRASFLPVLGTALATAVDVLAKRTPLPQTTLPDWVEDYENELMIITMGSSLYQDPAEDDRIMTVDLRGYFSHVNFLEPYLPAAGLATIQRDLIFEGHLSLEDIRKESEHAKEENDTETQSYLFKEVRVPLG